MLARRWSAYVPALRTWWFTSRFLTYQSPLRLLALFERYDQQADCHNGARIAVGDRVGLMDIERRHHYRVTLVNADKSRPLSGQLAVDSHLGAQLLGRVLQDEFDMILFHQRRRFVITDIVHSSRPPALLSVCGCRLCQSTEVKS